LPVCIHTFTIAQEYQRAFRASVLSSIAIEGVKKAAERALTPKRSPARV
jgi:hypothetical protein